MRYLLSGRICSGAINYPYCFRPFAKGRCYPRGGDFGKIPFNIESPALLRNPPPRETHLRHVSKPKGQRVADFHMARQDSGRMVAPLCYYGYLTNHQ